MQGKTTTQSILDQGVETDGSGHKPLVTVSGEYGAGAHEVGAALATQLRVGLFDYRTLDRIVAKAHTDRDLRSWLDEQQPLARSKWMQFLSAKNRRDMSDYLPHLVKTIVAIVPGGGVFIGRGAHLVLVGYQVFRLKVAAGPEFCARRIAAKEGITTKAAFKLAVKVNKERIQLVKEIYDHFPTEDTYYDLVLSAEILTPDQIVRITLAAMKEAQFPVQ